MPVLKGKSLHFRLKTKDKKAFDSLMSYVFLFAFFFFTAAHFHLVAACIQSIFLTATLKFSSFSFNESRRLLTFYLSL